MKIPKEKAGLLIVDVQEKLLPHVDRSYDILRAIQKVIKGFQTLHIPIFVSEQYPQGLGGTVEPLKTLLDQSQKYHAKTTFSCIDDENLKNELLKQPIDVWILAGIEAHVCVLQTAKDLKDEGKNVVVLNDAISSRSIYDFSTAIAEMRDYGIRITSTETVFFELLGCSTIPEFKKISELIK